MDTVTETRGKEKAKQLRERPEGGGMMGRQKNKTVAYATRALFPGKCVLLGFDTAGHILIGVRCKPKSAYRWLTTNQPGADRTRCQKALDDLEGGAP